MQRSSRSEHARRKRKEWAEKQTKMSKAAQKEQQRQQQNEGVRAIRKSPGVIMGEFRPIDFYIGGKPSLFSTPGLKFRWKALKDFFRTTLSVAQIKAHGITFKAQEFAKESQEQVMEMYAALADNDSEYLRQLVTPDLYGAVRKQRQPQLEFHGEASRPKVEYVIVSAYPDDKDMIAAQVTVRMELNVSTRGGEQQTVTSFPVFERISKKNVDTGSWVIAGFKENSKFGAFSNPNV